jgi:hypothetical protein
MQCLVWLSGAARGVPGGGGGNGVRPGPGKHHTILNGGSAMCASAGMDGAYAEGRDPKSYNNSSSSCLFPPVPALSCLLPLAYWRRLQRQPAPP